MEKIKWITDGKIIGLRTYSRKRNGVVDKIVKHITTIDRLKDDIEFVDKEHSGTVSICDGGICLRYVIPYSKKNHACIITDTYLGVTL